MKKLLFILFFVPFLANGQSKIRSLSWSHVLPITASTGDTIIQAYDYTDISGYCWSCTANAEGLSADDAQITFGGSDIVIGVYRGRYNVYEFNSFVHDSLPYTLDKTILEYENKVLGIVDTTYTKKITGGNVPSGIMQPAYWFAPGSCTDGDTLRVECHYFKL